MIKLAKAKPRGYDKHGDALEGTIQAAIRHAWDALPYVQCWRNNTGQLKNDRGQKVSYGLALGSSDLIGEVEVEALIDGEAVYNSGGIAGYTNGARSMKIGRFFAFEVKRPGQEPTPDQRIFLEVVARRGGAAGWGTSVDDAMRFIEAARLCREESFK